MFDYSQLGQVILRMTMIFAVSLVIVRLMGNRAVGQFSPFDFVLMVGIGDIVANVALDTKQSIIMGAEGLVALLVLQQLLARLSLKSTTLRKWFEGTPVVVVQDGKVLHENLKRTQFNLDDLRQELHKQGMDMSDVANIKLARLESCGDFSIIKNADVAPFSRRDMENFITSLSDNPLSPAGISMAKLEQLAADVRVLAEYVKQQQAPAAKAEASAPNAQDLH